MIAFQNVESKDACQPAKKKGCIDDQGSVYWITEHQSLHYRFRGRADTTVSLLIWPAGVTQVTESPTLKPINAVPTGVSTDKRRRVALLARFFAAAAGREKNDIAFCV